MSPKQLAREWAAQHLDAVVVLGSGPDAEPWRIQTTSGDAVLLRDLDDGRSRLASAETVRRAFLSENS